MAFNNIAVLLALVCVVVIRGGTIDLVNNAYRGLTIAIHSSTHENHELLKQIQELITRTSVFLHKATHQRAYIGDATIIVPSTWTPQPEYVPIKNMDHYNAAHIRVHNEKHPAHGNAPYTKQLGDCGEEGDYIHYTTDYFLNQTIKQEYGLPEKVLVHEWGHYRFGLFDEHGYSDSQQMPEMYFDENGKLKRSGCTDHIKGWIRTNTLKSCEIDVLTGTTTGCMFFPDQIQENVTASLMDLYQLESVYEFCDDHNHKSSPPTKHNFMCDGRSSWSVMLDHADFKSGNNPPRSITAHESIPKIRIAQPTQLKPTVVLVLDVSGSMGDPHSCPRIQRLHQSAIRFIKYEAPLQSKVGIVTFSTGAQQVGAMTKITSDTDRRTLASYVPSVADGWTAIGKGLQTALEMLRNNNEATDGALLILISDGEENISPHIADVLPEILASKVVINTIALGKQASDKLESLVKLTSGRGFFYSDDCKENAASGMSSAFHESVSTFSDVEIQSISVLHTSKSIDVNDVVMGQFTIDKDIGKSTQITISYDPDSAHKQPTIDVILHSPSGVMYNSASLGYAVELDQETVVFNIDKAEHGQWTYTITNKMSETNNVFVDVMSQPLDANVQPIKVTSKLPDIDVQYPNLPRIFAEVKKGYSSILGATVIAKVIPTTGQPILVRLNDDGRDPDMVKNDGMYSAYYTQFTGSGRYNVEVNVDNDGKAYISAQPGSGSSKLRLPPKNLAKEEQSKSEFSPEDLNFNYINKRKNIKAKLHVPVEPFTRSSVTGAFKVSNWQPDKDLIPPGKINDLTGRIVPKETTAHKQNHTIKLGTKFSNISTYEVVLDEGMYIQAGQTISGQIVIDDIIKRDLTLSTNLETLLVDVKLTSPNGSVYDMHDHDQYNNEISVFSLNEALPGVWTYVVKNNAPVMKYISLFATSTALPVEDQAIRIEVIGEFDIRQPKIMAKVSLGSAKILDAIVETHFTDNKKEEKMIRLRDDGKGGDSEADDGIYSGYFKAFNKNRLYQMQTRVGDTGHAKLEMLEKPGLYSLQMLHSRLPARQDKTRNNPAKQKEQQRLTDHDIIVRSAVMDLNGKVKPRKEQLILQLTWTSSGDDIDSGNSSEVIIFVASHRQHLLDTNDGHKVKLTKDMLTAGSLTALSPAGQTVSIELNLMKVMEALKMELKKPIALFFSIISVDEAGNKSAASHFAKVQYNH